MLDAPNAERQPGQKPLEAAGRIAIVWDLPTCLNAVRAFEIGTGIEPNPAVAAWLIDHGRQEVAE